jgi:hypothetical protein
MLHDFETGEEVESLLRQLVEAGEGIVGGRGKTLLTKPIREDSSATAKVENLGGLSRVGEGRGDQLGISGGAQIDVVGIDDDVIAVVDVLVKSFWIPGIEGRCEGKAALPASPEIYRIPGERKALPLGFDAALVEVYDAEERAGAGADLAFDGARIGHLDAMRNRLLR